MIRSMELPRVAQLQQWGMNITPANLSVKLESPRITQAASAKPELNIARRDPEIRTEWSRVWEDLGLPRPSSIAAELTASSQSHVLEAIVNIVQDGDRIGNIAAHEKDSIANVAWERQFRGNQPRIVLMALPRSGPKFDVTIYQPQIDIQTKPVQIQIQTHKPQIDVRLGDVDVYVGQRSRMDLTV